MTDFSDLDINQLLAEFLDSCRAGNGEAAYDTVDELRRKIWISDYRTLPRDPRPTPEEKAAVRDRITKVEHELEEIKLSVSVAFAQRQAAVRERITETERLRAENKRLLAASVALVQCRDVLEKVMAGIPANNEVHEAHVAAMKALGWPME